PSPGPAAHASRLEHAWCGCHLSRSHERFPSYDAAVVDVLQEAQSLIDAGHAAEALATIERAPSSVPALLLRARAELALDRFDHAHGTLRSIFRRDDVGGKSLANAHVLQATLLRRSSPLLDEALDSALRGASGAMRAADPSLAA